MQAQHSAGRILTIVIRRLRQVSSQALLTIAVYFLSAHLPHQQALATPCPKGASLSGCGGGGGGGGGGPPPTCPALPAPGTKVALAPYYTRDTPAAAVYNGKVSLAWTGTNADHSILVGQSCDGLNFPNAVIFGSNTSFAGPGLAAFQGLLWIGWAGDNRIDLATSSDGLNFGNQFLVGTQQTFNSYTSISLAATSSDLYLAFAGVDAYHTLNIAFSPDGVNFGAPAVHFGIDLWDNAAQRNQLPFATPYSSNIPGRPVTPPATLVNYNSNNGVSINFAGVLSLLESFINPPPAISVDSPTLTIAPDGSLIWGATALSTVEANAPNQYSWDSILVNGRSLISNNGAISGTGIGMATLGNTVYVAWVPSASSDIMIYAYQYGTYTLLSQMDTGQTCAGNPTLLAFNGHLYMYWMGTDSQGTVNAMLIQ
jgi:hypothetical protein